MNTAYIVFSTLLAAAGLSSFIALLRANIRKETVSQQAELIELLRQECDFLHRKDDEQQALIEQLHDRIKSLEGSRQVTRDITETELARRS